MGVDRSCDFAGNGRANAKEHNLSKVEKVKAVELQFKHGAYTHTHAHTEGISTTDGGKRVNIGQNKTEGTGTQQIHIRSVVE